MIWCCEFVKTLELGEQTRVLSGDAQLLVVCNYYDFCSARCLATSTFLVAKRTLHAGRYACPWNGPIAFVIALGIDVYSLEACAHP